MPRLEYEQLNFTAGELPAAMQARYDTKQYAAGLKVARNVVGLPYGPLRRRPGSRFIEDLGGKARLAGFSFNTAQNYLVAFLDQKIRIYQAQAFLMEIASPYLEAELTGENSIRWAQAEDTMVIVHEDHAPQRLLRQVGGNFSLPDNPFDVVLSSQTMTIQHPTHGLLDGQHVVFSGVGADFNGVLAADVIRAAGYDITKIDADSYTVTLPGTSVPTSTATGVGGTGITLVASLIFGLEPIPLKNIPVFDFNDALTPATTDEVQEISFDTNMAAGDQYRLKLELNTTWKITFATSTIENIDAIEQALRSLRNTSAEGIRVVHTGATESDHIYQVHFEGFDGNRNWGPLGVAYAKLLSGGTISVTTIVEGASGQEAVWSVTRGYPRSVTFHEQRMILAGSKSLPVTLWGSVTSDEFDFDKGIALESDGLNTQIRGRRRVNAIKHVVSGRHLVVLTTGDEFYSPDVPLKPPGSFLAQTNYGSSDVIPVQLDGQIIFAQNNGQRVRGLIFQEVEQAYQAFELSFLGRDIIRNPVDMTEQLGEDGEYLWLVNAQGKIALLNYNREQSVAGWTRVETRAGDLYQAVANVIGDTATGWAVEVYVYVTRQINGGTKHYLEVFLGSLDQTIFTQDGYLMDCAVRATSGSPTTAWTGLDHLEGELIDVVADDAYVGQYTVTAGAITLDREASKIEAGLDFLVEVEPLPLVAAGDAGSTKHRFQSIGELRLELLDSRGVTLEVADRGPETAIPHQIGAEALANPVPLFTGLVRHRTAGWSEGSPGVKISQSEPAPFTLRMIGYEYDVED